MMTLKHTLMMGSLVASSAILTACGGSNDNRTPEPTVPEETTPTPTPTPEVTPTPTPTPEVTPTPTPAVTPTPTPAPVAVSLADYLAGEVVYNRECSTCHGPLETSDRRGRSEAQIRTSVVSQPAMRNVFVAGDEEYRVLALALNNDRPESQTSRLSFSISVTNTTNNQPLSPIAVIASIGEYSAWSIGSAASDGLAVLAEDGNPDELLIEAAEIPSAAFRSDNPVAPGAEYTATFFVDLNNIDDAETIELTTASMLVNTNDAFSGVTGLTIGNLEIGESMSTLAPIYDAGTEANDELAENIPGPAGVGAEGGTSEGREANDIVTRHPGVVTSSDGYTESALDQSHRFDNGAMSIVVTRIENIESSASAGN